MKPLNQNLGEFKHEVPGFTKIMAWHERTHESEAHRWI